ncbi:alpha/beta hydrolase [Glaciecola siphonariae]|uniref:Alpha/beta hydrolase n=1 Tax=Glaciecola siphonariae TaxID=521012 RepID=A0ABV9M0C7_9ALTE
MLTKRVQLRLSIFSSIYAVIILLTLSAATFTYAQVKPSKSKAEHIEVEAFSLPKQSKYFSQATINGLAQQDALMQKARAKCNPYTKTSAQDIRTCEAQMYSVIMPKALARFEVDITPLMIDGVQTDVVVPKNGISANNQHRVLINLHGGGFKYGGRFGGQLESMPIASQAGIKVIAIDYKKAPDYRFPAANKDVETVYRHLLKTYPAENIGIFGCSAGSRVTGQAIVWLHKQDLPSPGAAAFLCSAPTALNGDSNYYAAALQQRKPLQISDVEYWEGLDSNNKDAFPGDFSDALTVFPPALMITSTRDYSLSPMVAMHAKLIALNKAAQLHVFEGFTHAQFMSMYVPESVQTTTIMQRFFEQHLGSQARE